MSTVSVSRNFFNSFLTPRFVQLYSGNPSVNLFAVYAFKYKLFIKILSLLLNTTLIVDKHCSDVCCDEFSVSQIDRKSKLECGPMSNLMVALPNVADALCSTPQSLAEAHY